MSRIFGRLSELPFHLVLIGVALGMLARVIHPPTEEVIAPRVFPDPIVEPQDSDFTDLDIV